MEEPFADDFELTIAELPVHRPAPGFYETRTRVYYVTAGGSAYLLAAPGQRAMLQAVDDLPSEATASGRTCDPRLRILAAVADELAAVRDPPTAPLEHRSAPS